MSAAHDFSLTLVLLSHARPPSFFFRQRACLMPFIVAARRIVR